MEALSTLPAYLKVIYASKIEFCHSAHVHDAIRHDLFPHIYSQYMHIRTDALRAAFPEFREPNPKINIALEN